MRLAATLAGYDIDQINEQWLWGAGWDWNVENGHMPEDGLLLAARLSAALFATLSVPLVFALGWLVGQRPAAYAVSFLLATHPVILLNGRRAYMESTLLFFSLLVVLAAAWWGRYLTAADEANRRGRWWGPLLLALDKAALWVFTVELALKVWVYRSRFTRDGWNVFDFVIVAIAWLPATGPLAVLRALRIMRVLRLVSVVPQMRAVIGALFRSLPGMGSIVAVLMLVFYVAAVMATKLFGEQFPQWFGTIGESMFSLFQVMTLESWSMGIVRPVMEIYPAAWAFFVPFIVVTSFTVLNLFIALIVNSMQSLQAETKKELRAEATVAHDERELLLRRIDRLTEERDAILAQIAETWDDTYQAFAKIQKAIEEKNFEGLDYYGVPIISLEAALDKSVNVGLGPLHTQFDSVDGVCYTSIYVDSQVTKWNYKTGKVLDTLPVHYNIGHLMTMEGDSRTPDGRYLVALNKLSIDRFAPVGPLHPQNHQLIDISNDKMQLLYDMPLPLGEPHYAVAIRADKLKPGVRYKSGWNSRTDQRSEFRTRAGREKTERNCDAEGNCAVEVFGTTIRSHITPEIIEAEAALVLLINLAGLLSASYLRDTLFLQGRRAMAVLLIFTHRENLARMRSGTENRFEKARLLKRR